MELFGWIIPEDFWFYFAMAQALVIVLLCCTLLRVIREEPLEGREISPTGIRRLRVSCGLSILFWAM